MIIDGFAVPHTVFTDRIKLAPTPQIKQSCDETQHQAKRPNRKPKKARQARPTPHKVNNIDVFIVNEIF